MLYADDNGQLFNDEEINSLSLMEIAEKNLHVVNYEEGF